jgi:hypothetical protein
VARTTPEEAFLVRCNRTTMARDNIDNGRLICPVGIAPVKPAEFVVVRIGQRDDLARTHGDKGARRSLRGHQFHDRNRPATSAAAHPAGSGGERPTQIWRLRPPYERRNQVRRGFVDYRTQAGRTGARGAAGWDRTLRPGTPGASRRTPTASARSRAVAARRVADGHSEVNAEAAIREIMDRETRAWNTADVPLC